jgi:hypothetical protein
MDEAGYGPNLGPLVISASVWQLPAGWDEADLSAALKEAVCERSRDAQGRIPLADSKAIYSRAAGIAELERGVLVALRVAGQETLAWPDLWLALEPLADPASSQLPWSGEVRFELPLAAHRDRIAADAARLRSILEFAGLRLTAVETQAIFPAQFNGTAEQLGSKGELLSRSTIQLLGRVLGRCPGGPVRVICDRHGGRRRYARLLQQQFPATLVEVHDEAAAASHYGWRSAEQRVDVHFRVGAEAALPVALASMVSKYLRELAMRAFNQFWQSQVTGLRPTAGYPVDARRFMQDIAPARAALGMDDRRLWRSR